MRTLQGLLNANPDHALPQPVLPVPYTSTDLVPQPNHHDLAWHGQMEIVLVSYLATAMATIAIAPKIAIASSIKAINKPLPPTAAVSLTRSA